MPRGLHRDEFIRRMRGEWLRVDEVAGVKYDIYRTVNRRPKNKPARISKWLTHSYPLVDRGYSRNAVNAELERLRIPYLVTSECDMCPHKDWPRWERTSPAVIDEVAEVEEMLKGEFFFTDLRIPIKRALPVMKQKHERRIRQRMIDGVQQSIFGDPDEPDFGCTNNVCGM